MKTDDNLDQDIIEEELDEPVESEEELSPSTDAQDLEQLKEQNEQLSNQLKRAVADYQNLEKRVEAGRSAISLWAIGDLVGKLVNVLDHFEKALNGASEEERKSGWFRGVELSVKQFQNVLKDEGLDEIEADGQFDPTLHEAVDMREGKDGEILEVAEKGYNLNGKILKPAKVVVGKKKI